MPLRAPCVALVSQRLVRHLHLAAQRAPLLQPPLLRHAQLMAYRRQLRLPHAKTRVSVCARVSAWSARRQVGARCPGLLDMWRAALVAHGVTTWHACAPCAFASCSWAVAIAASSSAVTLRSTTTLSTRATAALSSRSRACRAPHAHVARGVHPR